MALLLLKLGITPIAVAFVTMLARRFGPAAGGWVAAIPFTSAPVVLFLALDQGTAFATTTALGILAATASQAAFALAYAWTAVRLSWYAALIAGTAAFAGCTVGLDTLRIGVASGLAIVVGSLALALALMPPTSPAAVTRAADEVPLRADVLLRAAVATAVVLAVTSLAPRIGPTLAGLVSPFPLFGAIFMAFPHRRFGAAAGIAAARGLLFGLFACGAFFAVLAQLLPSSGLAIAYLAAIAAGIAVQGAVLLTLRRSRVPQT
jgi:hypothetical protein